MGADLLRLMAQDEAMRAEDDAKPLRTCPICGNGLDINARGERNCDVGHFRTTRQTVGGV